MTDPRRWLDSDEQERQQHRALLEQAPARRPLDTATRRKLRRRVVRLSASAVGASVFFVWLKALASALGFGLVISAATVATLVARDRLFRPSAHRAAPRSTPSTSAIAAAQERSVAAEPPAAQPTTLAHAPASAASAPTQPLSARPVARRAPPTIARPQAETIETPTEPSPVATATVSPASIEPRVEPSPDSLERERLLLEPARVALARDPREALRAIDHYQRAFSNGQLFAESEYIAIEALRRAGERERAATRADELVRRFPHSVYGTILRRQR